MSKKVAKKLPTAKTVDGFANFAARLGVNPHDGSGSGNNLTSQGFYIPNLITRNRLQLEYGYRGSWIVAKMINTVSEDMTRAGIAITTNEGADQVSEIEIKMTRLKIWSSICETLMWGRLYGGAIGVMQIRGQKLDTPINLDSVEQDQFMGITPYDRWQIYPVLDKLINEGPDLGLPEYYDIVLGANMNNPGQEPGGQMTENPNGRVRVHHSRCIRVIGIKLPFWQAITEMLWGESVLEQLWDRLIEFDTATAAAGNLINRAQLRMIGVEGLREIFAAGGAAQEALIEMFEYIRKFQQNEGITLLDKNDTFDSVAYSFAGLADVLIQFGQQLSGASDIPLVRLFGQSPAGLSSTGESDLRMYYDGILAKQEATLRNPLEILLKVLWRSTTGKPAPKDMTFEFVPLWQMSAKDKADIAKVITDAILEVHEAGIIKPATALKELKEMSGDHGIFTHITDEEIEEAENDEPPKPDEADVGSEPSAGTGNLGAGPTKPKELVKKAQSGATGDSAWKRIRHWFTKDKWEEGKHKRGEGGQFGSGGKHEQAKKEKSDADKTPSPKITQSENKLVAEIEGAGKVEAEVNGKEVTIKAANVKPEKQGFKLGTKIYSTLIDHALEKGMTVKSDATVKAPAIGVYKNLAKMGYEVEKNPKAKEGGSNKESPLLYVPKGEAVFTIKKKSKSKDNYSEKTYVSGEATKGEDSVELTKEQECIRKFLEATNDAGVAATMKEFYKGILKSSSGNKVTSKKQAAAIGYSEERAGK